MGGDADVGGSGRGFMPATRAWPTEGRSRQPGTSPFARERTCTSVSSTAAMCQGETHAPPPETKSGNRDCRGESPVRAGSDDALSAEVNLECRNAECSPNRGPDLSGKVWRGRQFVAVKRGGKRELTASLLHTVARIAGKAHDRLSRLSKPHDDLALVIFVIGSLYGLDRGLTFSPGTTMIARRSSASVGNTLPANGHRLRPLSCPPSANASRHYLPA
jgi:hypothetical protein